MPQNARLGELMSGITTLSVLGSCRVYDPSKLLETTGRARLNQQNIFGFVHNSREVLQQLGILTGATPVPRRLRPFLNIGEKWDWQPRSTDSALDYKFARTDCFIVEVSSIRLLRFKAMYLQLNRTRELLADNPEIDKAWWTPLIKDGRNNPEAYPVADQPAVHREIVAELSCAEQTGREVLRDAIAIAEILPRPVLFVSHFNVTESGRPIKQRQMIVDALGGLPRRNGIGFLDPTDLVLAEGPVKALKDGAHYNPDFLPKLAELLEGRVAALLAEQQAERPPTPDRYEFSVD